MKKLNEKEKEEIISNSISSFEHGIEHLLMIGGEKENSLKFSILHIFHALELIVKAHLGEINEALLWEKIDNRSEKTADISLLIKRRINFH